LETLPLSIAYLKKLAYWSKQFEELILKN
jgi:hypothetical protein